MVEIKNWLVPPLPLRTLDPPISVPHHRHGRTNFISICRVHLQLHGHIFFSSNFQAYYQHTKQHGKIAPQSSVNSGFYGDRLWYAKINCDLPQLLQSWWNIITLIIYPYILIWPTSKLHNLDTIFLVYRKVSPKLRVVIIFYNSFISHIVLCFVHPDCEPFVNGNGHHTVFDILY
jgi:hypothetical protein